MENVLDKILSRKRREQLSDDELIEAHHILMTSYGWIPLEEFKKLPAATMLNLLEKIQRDNKKNQIPRR